MSPIVYMKFKSKIKKRPKLFVGILSVIGYIVLFIAIFSLSNFFPELTGNDVNLLSDIIAIINTITIVVLSFGWYSIRKGDINNHKNAMIISFLLILIFLILYITKTGGGGTKVLIPPEGQIWVKSYIYLPILGIHLILSIISVPVVLYAIVLGLTHTPTELVDTPKKKIGRIAVLAWILSLILGIITYIILNIYPTEISQGSELFISLI